MKGRITKGFAKALILAALMALLASLFIFSQSPVYATVSCVAYGGIYGYYVTLPPGYTVSFTDGPWVGAYAYAKDLTGSDSELAPQSPFYAYASASTPGGYYSAQGIGSLGILGFPSGQGGQNINIPMGNGYPYLYLEGRGYADLPSNVPGNPMNDKAYGEGDLWGTFHSDAPSPCVMGVALYYGIFLSGFADSLGTYDGYATVGLSITDITDPKNPVLVFNLNRADEIYGSNTSGTKDYTGSLSGSFWADLDKDYYLFISATGQTINYNKPSPIPEPGTLILIGSGLAGLAGYVRVKLSRKKG